MFTTATRTPTGNRAQRMARRMMSDSRAIIYTMFGLTGAIMVLEFYAAPSGPVQVMFLLPFLSGMAMAFARTSRNFRENLAGVRFAAAAVAFAAAAAAVLTWCTVDAASTHLNGWVQAWSMLGSWTVIATVYAVLAAVAYLGTFALAKVLLTQYREPRPAVQA